MSRQSDPPVPFDRVAGLLAGCPDPGGVLTPATRPSPRRAVTRPPLGAVVPGELPALPPGAPDLELPANVTFLVLALALGVKAHVLNRELIPLGIFASQHTILPFAVAAHVCARLGVRARSA